jgi:hypothetical protein
LVLPESADPEEPGLEVEVLAVPEAVLPPEVVAGPAVEAP